MFGRTNIRRYLLTIAAVALVGSGLGVAALAQSDAGDVFTGCLNENSGVLKRVAVGFEPATACNQEESQITWDRAGSAFEGRIAALEESVAELEEPFGTLELFVDCDAGETVGAALDEAETHLGPVNIIISGVCDENVGINRDDVNVFGLERSDGIRSSSPGSAVSIGSRGVRFFNMTISGGNAGIEGGPGSSFSIDGVTVRDAITWGVLASAGSSADLRDCIVENTTSGAGITAFGGSVTIQGCSTTGNSEDGLKSEVGGTIIGFTVDLSSNGRFGAVAGASASIFLEDSTISNNGAHGVTTNDNASVFVGNSIIANNGDEGAAAGTGSSIKISSSVVEGNEGSGISASQASTVSIDTTTIRANTHDGVVLNDQSNGSSSGAGITIADNGGFGINCAGPPGFPVVQNGFNIPDIQFSANASGDSNCP